jgi:hypothetical protein
VKKKPYETPAILESVEPVLRPCCYGFIDSAEVPTKPGEGSWTARAQRPFRASWLWVWGGADAVLSHIVLAQTEQLVVPMAFPQMQRECPPETFLKHVHVEPTPQQLQHLISAETTPLLQMGLTKPSLVFSTVNVGAEITFKFHGAVRGVVLVGVEAL